ncbi:hypothetical protein, partial [Hyella patelloides]|uniref:hypothetical protein n=1 Tax=Hyella patelloides TaxID=1982969 RepID=UPI001643BF78
MLSIKLCNPSNKEELENISSQGKLTIKEGLVESEDGHYLRHTSILFDDSIVDEKSNQYWVEVLQ